MQRAKEKKLDESQAAARDSVVNTVVTAGAGSGKTTVLAERFIRLALDNTMDGGVDRILTLTFTRKAAAEMHDRIYAGLLARRDQPGVREELARFDRAVISTIDGFCAELVRGCASRYGVPPTFTQDEAAVAALCEEEALRFVLGHRTDPALAGFLALYGFEAVWREVFTALGAEHLSAADVPDYAACLQAQLELCRAELASLVEQAESVRAAVAGLRPESDKAAKEAAAAAGAMPPLPGLLAAGPPYAGLAAALETLGGFQLPRSKKDACAGEYRESVETIRRIEAAERGRGLIAFLSQEDRTRGLLGLCAEYHAAVNRLKRAGGALSFHDVMELAIRALRDDRGLREHYKRRFSRIMIDEFQDNDERQKRLLYLLAERTDRHEPQPSPAGLEQGKLFFVGDEKQSIYLFRGADVSVFKKLEQELGRHGGAGLSLEYNYRSTPRLIGFFNELFERIMAGSGADFEARHSRARPAADTPDFASRIRVAWSQADQAVDEEEENAENDDAEALYVGRLIRGWVEEGLAVRDGSGTRPLRYGDVAILMRSLSNQYRFERALRALGVPCRVQETRSLFLEAPANDFYAALQLALYPEDRAAYAALLRSPFVNLADSSLLRVLLREEPPFAPAGLDGDDALRFAAGAALIETLRRRMRTEGTDRLVSFLWHEAGYRYFMLKDPRLHAYLSMYDYLLELARTEHGRKLSDFLDYLRARLGSYEKIEDVELTREDGDQVRLMSVHKAKGLEFPVAILANAGNVGRSDSSARPMHYHPDYGPSFAVAVGRDKNGKILKRNVIFELLREEERETAELKRLVYVACTRARDHLVVTGSFNKRNACSGWETKSPLGLVLSALGLDPDVPANRAREAAAAGFSGVEFEAIPPARREDFFTPAGAPPREPAAALELYRRAPPVERPAGRVEWTATALQELWDATRPAAAGAERLPLLDFDGRLAREEEAWFGTLCHALIVLRLGRGLFGRTSAAESAALLPADQARGAPAEPGYERMLESAAGLSDRFFDSPCGRAAAEAEQKSGERSFALRWDIPGGRRLIVRGAMDLVLLTAGKCLVVDFKTDQKIISGAYELQLELYRRAAAALYGKPVETSLFYLRAGREVAVAPLGAAADEWAADSTLFV